MINIEINKKHISSIEIRSKLYQLIIRKLTITKMVIRLPAVQCVPCKLVNAGPDELRGTYLLDMVALFVFAFVFVFVPS